MKRYNPKMFNETKYAFVIMSEDYSGEYVKFSTVKSLVEQLLEEAGQPIDEAETLIESW